MVSERTAVAGPGGPPSARAARERDVTLLELLDRLLDGGVAIDGERTLAVADIDLVRGGLRLVAAAVDSLEAGSGAEKPWCTSTP
jgi:hypothetical protein